MDWVSNYISFVIDNNATGIMHNLFVNIKFMKVFDLLSSLLFSTAHSTLWSIITWLRCFFPGFDRFIPGFDRFIPGFDRFIPASIPVTGTLPPTIKNISSKKNVFFKSNFIFFLFHWFEITQSRNIQQCPECIFFLKNAVNTNPKLFRAQFNATGCRLWITACDRSLQNVVNVTQKTLF